MSLISTGNGPAEWLVSASKALAIDLTNFVGQCNGRLLNSYQFLNDFFLGRLVPWRARWAVEIAVAGVAAEIRARFPSRFANDAAVTTELNAIDAGLAALIAWTGTNVRDSILTDANGYILILRITNNQMTHRIITSAAQCDSLKAQLQTALTLLVS